MNQNVRGYLIQVGLSTINSILPEMRMIGKGIVLKKEVWECPSTRISPLDPPVSL